MTLHYHGTPISPVARLYELAGRCFCVSHYKPDDVKKCHEIGSSVMLDNGAFSPLEERHGADGLVVLLPLVRPLAGLPTTWAIPPDV